MRTVDSVPQLLHDGQGHVCAQTEKVSAVTFQSAGPENRGGGALSDAYSHLEA